MIETQTMRTVQVYSYGGPEQLKFEEKLLPEPREGEVLLRVYAAGVNPIDWKLRQGLMAASQPVTFPYTPGIEVAGVIEKLGAGVSFFEVGQAVFGWSTRGAYAEYVTEAAEALALKPEALSFAEAAGLPVGAATAWRALFEHGGLTAGQRVLIQGAAGGVGLFAVQLAKWKGADVIGTASSANLAFVRELGADLVVDYTAAPVESVVQDVDLVLDCVGPATLDSSLATLRRGGTLISIAGFPLQELAQERGVRALMSRGTRPSGAFLDTINQLIAEGHLKVIAGKTFPFSAVRQAQEYSQSGHGRGRIVLQMVDEIRTATRRDVIAQ